MEKQTSLEHRLSNLKGEHEELEVQLARSVNDLIVDSLDVSRMKKQKLKVKDMIQEIEQQLENTEDVN